jgi:hypothetical protein
MNDVDDLHAILEDGVEDQVATVAELPNWLAVNMSRHREALRAMGERHAPALKLSDEARGPPRIIL